MSRDRQPGPLSQTDRPLNVQDGTLMRFPAHPQGPQTFQRRGRPLSYVESIDVTRSPSDAVTACYSDDDLRSICLEMIAILRSRVCQRISFRYKRCTVDSAQYLSVARHLAAGRIMVENNQSNSNGRGGIKAYYHDLTNRVGVPTSFLLIP